MSHDKISSVALRLRSEILYEAMKGPPFQDFRGHLEKLASETGILLNSREVSAVAGQILTDAYAGWREWENIPDDVKLAWARETSAAEAWKGDEDEWDQ